MILVDVLYDISFNVLVICSSRSAIFEIELFIILKLSGNGSLNEMLLLHNDGLA